MSAMIGWATSLGREFSSKQGEKEVKLLKESLRGSFTGNTQVNCFFCQKGLLFYYIPTHITSSWPVCTAMVTVIILSAFMCLCNLMLANIIALQILEHTGKECCISINYVLESVQTTTSSDFQPQGISEDVIVDSLRRVATFSKKKPITEVNEFLSCDE